MAVAKESSSSAVNEIHHLPQSDMPLRALPPLSALLAFERAAAQLSFRRAALDLALSPSAISHQIRNLEGQLGAKLFVRDGRSVRLTEQGERFRRQVSGALTMLERATRDAASRGRVGAHEIWISSLPFFTSTVLLPALDDFRRDHPQITLRIEATHQYADFAGSGVDVAIRYGRENSAGLKLEPLVKVKPAVVCAPRLARDGLRAVSDLSRHTLIHLTRRPRAWPAWLSSVGAGRLEPRGHLWLDSLPTILEATEQGLGVALAMDPLIAAHPGFGSRLVVPFETEAGRGESFYLVSRAEQSADSRIRSVRRWIVHAVRRAAARPRAAATKSAQRR
jgi:LysR family transcriptional regulator, glycine cleavage system transcriptional activator